jgi:hypothetical protein
MRQFRLVMSIMMVAMAASGCGQKTDANRTATKVLRPDEVKISLGNQAESKPAPPAAETPAEKPAATEANAP